MPWREVSTMSLRQEFVALARSRAIAFSTLCQRFGISRKTGYKWIDRALVAIANANGEVRLHGRKLRVPKTLSGLPIAFRPRITKDGHYDLYFCHHRFGEIDLNDSSQR